MTVVNVGQFAPRLTGSPQGQEELNMTIMQETKMQTTKYWKVYSWMPTPTTARERRMPLLAQPRTIYRSEIIDAPSKAAAKACFLKTTNEAGRCITIRLAKPSECSTATIIVSPEASCKPL
jgi:hypothetical protein